jgi:uncharacterized membrane protein
MATMNTTNMALAIAFHASAAAIWVGGMFFLFMVLRPSTSPSTSTTALDTQARLALWHRVLRRYFIWVWLSIVALLASGFSMVFFGFGGLVAVRVYVRAMMMIGMTMTALHLWLYFAPWRRFRRALQTADWSRAEIGLPRIRMLVGVNLLLGLINVVLGASGRYLS